MPLVIRKHCDPLFNLEYDGINNDKNIICQNIETHDYS